MERKIGETFKYEGKTLKVEESKCGLCDGCFFKHNCSISLEDKIGFCEAEGRTDEKKVIFVEVYPQEPPKLNLCEILKNCPKGFKLYSLARGEVTFCRINKNHTLYPIEVEVRKGIFECYSPEGKIFKNEGECILVPSKDQRDWNKFTAPWYKKDRFNPKMLMPFDKVLARLDSKSIWCCELFSFIEDDVNLIKCCGAYYKYCIPFNDDTKHLVGTTAEAPKYYKYWED